MRKTAAQIADEVLTKLSSRWREAIRSGEIQGPEAEALKKRMGVSMDREIAGLERGAINRLQRHGGTYYRGPSGILRGMRSGDINAQTATSAIPGGAVSGFSETAGGIKPSIAHLPGYSEYQVARMGGASRRRAVSPQLAKQIRPIVLGHEAAEVGNVMRGVGKGSIPQLYRTFPRTRAARFAERAMTESAGVGHRVSERLGRTHSTPQGIAQALVDPMNPATMQFEGGRHASPRVILEETRNSRMLSPEAQDVFTNVRRNTGEGAHMRAVTNTPAGQQPYLPKHRLSNISKGMRGEATRDIGAMTNRMTRRIETPIWKRVARRLRRR